MTRVSDLQPSDDPVRAAAESVEGSMEDQIYVAFAALADDFVHPTEYDFLVSRLQQDLDPARRSIVKAFLTGRNGLYDQVGPMDADEPIRKDSEIEFRFDRVAPTTMYAAQAFAAQWVREIADETRTQINATIQQMLAEGAPVPRIGQAVKESIGLTQAQAGAVANYRRMLEERSPDAFDRSLRDRRFDVSLRSHLAGLRPLSGEQIDRQVAAYHERYLRFRAKTIARFESLFASNSGAIAGIRHAVSTGALPQGTRKIWLLARDERVCPKCKSIPEIQPDGVGIDEAFEWRVDTRRGGRGGTVDMPPLHPLCRCTATFRVMK